MLFHSTRGQDKDRTFSEVLMQGLARDGGLFMPNEWPQVDIKKIQGMQNFHQVAKYIIPFFTSSSFSEEDTHKVLEDTWHNFESEDLVEIKSFKNFSILELFHGPTAAFKDFGLQLAAAFFNKVLEQENKTALVLGATSGDTGSAAIDSCKKYSRIKSFILLPNGNMSDVQRRQMTTVNAENVFSIRLNGTFDDCQDLVKEAFIKRDFLLPDQYLLAVNSINWTRIIGQICYYFYAFTKLSKIDNLNFSIPTGNFGNVFASYSAYRMGLPISKISVAVNQNDILHRFFSNNDYSKKLVNETISPSMDISVASNFERLIYDFFLDRDADKCRSLFKNFPNQPIELDQDIWLKKNSLFTSTKMNDSYTKKIIKKVFNDHAYILDPHTAVALKVAIEESKANAHYIVLATAHPAKFPNIYDELNIELDNIPRVLMNLNLQKEYFHSFDANYDDLSKFIKSRNL